MTPVRHLILDRDGVLNQELDEGWIAHPGQWRWERRALEALARFTAAGVRISVATNQSCIGRGVVSREAVDAVHRYAVELAARVGVTIAGVFVCPHAPGSGCACRKPRPGLVIEAMAACNIPPQETLFVGDAPRDLEAGRAAGVRSALVRTGKGRATEAAGGAPPELVFDDLWHAAEVLLGDLSGTSRSVDGDPESV